MDDLIARRHRLRTALEATLHRAPSDPDGTDETVSFTITGATDGLEIYGGFEGNESNRDERAPKQHVTALSGDLGGDDTTNDDGVTKEASESCGDSGASGGARNPARRRAKQPRRSRCPNVSCQGQSGSDVMCTSGATSRRRRPRSTAMPRPRFWARRSKPTASRRPFQGLEEALAGERTRIVETPNGTGIDTCEMLCKGAIEATVVYAEAPEAFCVESTAPASGTCGS